MKKTNLERKVSKSCENVKFAKCGQFGGKKREKVEFLENGQFGKKSVKKHVKVNFQKKLVKVAKYFVRNRLKKIGKDKFPEQCHGQFVEKSVKIMKKKTLPKTTNLVRKSVKIMKSQPS